MALRGFKRMREEGARHRDDVTPRAPNPWTDQEPLRLSDLSNASTTTDDKAKQYGDWAERMREKRLRAQRARFGQSEDADPNAHWSADALFAESQRLDEEERYDRPNPWRVGELLAEFDLREDATPAEVTSAYKRLAKAHHPDRYVAADGATQQEHGARRAAINRAYRALKQLERA